MDAQYPKPAVNELGRLAQAAGYDPIRAIERFAYGSFVSPARRYMYMETPKAACTSFKHLIAVIEGVAIDPAAAPYQRETRTDMLIHQRRHFALPTLLTASAEARAAILAKAPGWMIFALVRNPFSRLVSFFEHKIRMGEPGYERMEARYGDAGRLGGLAKSFARFVEEVVADSAGPRNVDVHMMPQNTILMPRLVPYTHIFRLEKVDEAVAALGAHLGSPLPALMRGRTAARDWRTYYDADSAGIVRHVYEEDFALFGYDGDDWRPRRDAPSAASQEEYWRGEVVARNHLIQSLYDLLGVPPANSFVEKSPFKNGRSSPPPDRKAVPD